MEIKTRQPRNTEKVQAIFPKGELGPAENSTGNAWYTSLVANDKNLVIPFVSNVHPLSRRQEGTFKVEPDYHRRHRLSPAKRATSRQTIKKGDVVKCTPI